MTVLSVNMNVAGLLRNRRNQPWPNMVDLARRALSAGAASVTVHPRPDERHTKASDVRNLRALIDAEFPDRELNVEGYPDDRFLTLVHDFRADQVTLVPDAPEQPTSDHGWDFVEERNLLAPVVARLKANGQRVAVFADADAGVMGDAAATGADRVELYTGPYGGAHKNLKTQANELDCLAAATVEASRNGLDVNAGHDLTVENLTPLVRRIPDLAEVSVGHALFCDTLTFGIEKTVQRYLLACEGRTE
ncbi:pyridoxine 5'-phosphate synthase [Aliiroseovarius sp. 2305UL8-7]|uniref:pyridoxine 5'-phosphate synthase n=1 Tax=Aliiroseovarius conchicola TaxID=3121637 RepID=UPI00352922C2